MEFDRGVVRGVDRADHDVLVERNRVREDCLDQLSPDAGAAAIGPDVHRVLDGKAIARPGAAPVAERTKALRYRRCPDPRPIRGSRASFAHAAMLPCYRA